MRIQNVFSILLLLQILGYVSYRCSVILEHSKRFDLIINSCTALNICLI